METNRRSVLKTTTAATLTAGLPTILKAQSAPDQIKIGIVGCGGRGSGALIQALKADPGVVLWSIGDAFEGGLENARRIGQRTPKQYDCPKEREFIGLDAYQGVIASGVDVVLLCTPPHFRPQHIRAAVEAGKHIFAEKPMAVDMAGIRSVVQSVKMAKEKGVAIQHGFCWRFEPAAREAYGKVHQGELGRLVSVYGTYMLNPVQALSKDAKKPAGMGDVEWQLRHWFNFEWLAAGPLVEQCIHTVDKVAWALGDIDPVAVVANGGRAFRDDASNLFDHYNVAYEYPNGIIAHVGQRQYSGCHSEVRDRVYCADGTVHVTNFGTAHATDAANNRIWRYRAKDTAEQNPYQVCHNEFFGSLRAGKIINTGDYMVKSTALGLFGREAAHTGQRLKWTDFWASAQDLAPDDLKLTDAFPVAPVPKPGPNK